MKRALRILSLTWRLAFCITANILWILGLPFGFAFFLKWVVPSISDDSLTLHVMLISMLWANFLMACGPVPMPKSREQKRAEEEARKRHSKFIRKFITGYR